MLSTSFCDTGSDSSLAAPEEVDGLAAATFWRLGFFEALELLLLLLSGRGCFLIRASILSTIQRNGQPLREMHTSSLESHDSQFLIATL